MKKLNELKKLLERGQATHRITMDVTEQFADEVYKMFEYLKRQAGIGHSFSVVVDPGSSGEEKFYVDGDGNSHIVDLKIEELDEQGS